MKTLTAFALTLFGFVALSPLAAEAGWDPRKDQELLKKSKEAIGAFKKKDPSLKIFFKEAYGYVVFPNITKGGLIVGGAHGNGVVYRKGKIIGRASLSQGTFGLQAGGKTYSEIIFFKDKASFDHLINGSLEFAAQATANAVKSGGSADADYSKGVAVFSMATGGLMAEASIGGQKFKYKPAK
ncbi:MAG: hypothetical protein ACE5LB_15275 [Acidiferrobacterales bacterium]